jgi:hypothetical protein
MKVAGPPGSQRRNDGPPDAEMATGDPSSVGHDCGEPPSWKGIPWNCRRPVGASASPSTSAAASALHSGVRSTVV